MSERSGAVVETPTFRDWLLEELRLRGWSQSELARRLEIPVGVVNKWLRPESSPNYRRPTYDNCVVLARVLHKDVMAVLELAGHSVESRSRALTDLQRDTMSIIPLLPDEVLAVVYHQLRALADQRIQAQVRRAIEDYHEFRRSEHEPEPDPGNGWQPGTDQVAADNRPR